MKTSVTNREQDGATLLSVSDFVTEKCSCVSSAYWAAIYVSTQVTMCQWVNISGGVTWVMGE